MAFCMHSSESRPNINKDDNNPQGKSKTVNFHLRLFTLLEISTSAEKLHFPDKTCAVWVMFTVRRCTLTSTAVPLRQYKYLQVSVS